MSNQQNQTVKQYDKNGREIGREEFHDFKAINPANRFNPQQRYDEIFTGNSAARIEKEMHSAGQVKESLARDSAAIYQYQPNEQASGSGIYQYQPNQQASGSSSGAGNGKEVQKPYDPVKDVRR
ncbi:hypothetical protein EAE96_001867 [Botrytis aclada]|nr:hypothetical protein EAE96_001867 [Botrytis aclada]